MKLITITMLLSMGLCGCQAQEAELDLLRLSRRVPISTLGEKQIDQINSLSGDSGLMRTYVNSHDNFKNERKQKESDAITYKINGNNNKEMSDRKHISKVTVQLHLDDRQDDESSHTKEMENDNHQQNVQFNKNIYRKEEESQHDSADSDSGASNMEGAVSYAMPPESFLNNYRKEQEINFYENNAKYISTPGQQTHFFTTLSSKDVGGVQQPSGISDIIQQQQGRGAGGANVQIIAPPPQHYYSNQPSARIQYLSSSQQLPQISESHSNYLSTPTSNNLQKISSHQQVYNFVPQGQNSKVQYVSSPASSIQLFSTPTPASQFLDQVAHHKMAESVNQYVATPAPSNNIQPSIAPNNFYVSTASHLVPTQSPVQYATSSPTYESRINNYQSQISNKQEKHMQIDHFDNAASGVRNPKYSPIQPTGHLFVSTTPGPIVISSTASPNNQEKKEFNWKTPINSIFSSQPQAVFSFPSQAAPLSNFQSQLTTAQSQSAQQNNFQTQASVLTDFQSQSTPLNKYQPQPTNNYQSQSSALNGYQSQTSAQNGYQSQIPSQNGYQTQTSSQNAYQSSQNSYQPQNSYNQNDNAVYGSPQQLYKNQQDSGYPSNSRPLFSGLNNQRESLFANEVDVANNLMLNALNQNYIGEKQRLMKATYQRDVDKDIDVAPTSSQVSFGWKLNNNNKRGSVESSHHTHDVYGDRNHGLSYPVSSPASEIITSETVTRQSPQPVVEYRPYPDNPFLNHISFATASPPLNTGSIQTINFKPNNNQQHNVNVGYSIGFGGQTNSGHNNVKTDQTTPAKYGFNENSFSFTTVSSSPSTIQGDIIKGIKVTEVNVPDQSLLQKYSNERNYPTASSEPFKTSNSKQFSFSSPANQISSDNSFKSAVSKSSDVPSTGKLYQYFINTPVTKQTNIQSSYHGGDESKGQNYKWSSIIGAGVEVSSSPNVEIMKQVVRESTAPNSIIYLNRESAGDASNSGNSFYYPHQKDSNKYIQNFDHEKALKNIQPIGLSNVVSQSSALGANAAVVTISPQNNVFSNRDMREFTQNYYKVPQNSFSTPSPIEYSVDNSYKNFINNNKEKPVLNFQNYKPSDFQAVDSNELRSYVFGNTNDAKLYESSLNIHNQRFPDDSRPVHFVYKPPTSESRIHSVNAERHNIEYTPSETFRQSSKNNYQLYKNEQNQPQINRISTHDQIQKNSDDFHAANQQLSPTRFSNPFFINQDINSHKMEPSAASSDTMYQLVSTSNKRFGSEDNNDSKENEYDGKILTINGMKVANPYNINLQVLSDFLQGKPVFDESKLDTYNNLQPVDLDTTLMRDMISRNEKIHFDVPKDMPDDMKNFPTYEYLRSSRRKAVESDITPIKERPKTFQKSYESSNDVPEFDDEDHEHNHETLGSHHIGAVIDQPIGFVPSSRSNDELTAPELDGNESQYSSDTDDPNNDEDKPVEEQSNAVKEHNEKYRNPEIKSNSDVELPYPLLQPPPPSPLPKGQKKSDRRPYVPRRPHHHHHHRISKSSREEIHDKIRNIQPPPVLIIKKINR